MKNNLFLAQLMGAILTKQVILRCPIYAGPDTYPLRILYLFVC
jgi:hypothetical protein